MSYLGDSKLCQLDNARGVVKTQSKTIRTQQDNISRYNDSVRFRNDILQKGPKYSGGPVLLLCAMCEGQVNRRSGTKKNRTIQIGFQSILVPCYKCSVCGTNYSGHLPNIKCDDNPELEAELVQYSGIR